MLYMIEEISFKRLLDVIWTILLRDAFGNPIKIL